jgi:outer membrane protein TolC
MAMNLFFVLILSISIISCTKPVSQLLEERLSYSLQDLECLNARIGNVDTIELTIDEAIQFALTHNLQLRAFQAEMRVTGDAIATELIRMLPDLTYNSYNAVRSNLLIASSTSVEPGIPPAPPSFSSLRATNTWTAELSWNLLNAGVQYFRVKEAKNTLLAKELTYVRSAQDLTREVVTNYWLVATMQSNAVKLEELTSISIDLAEKLRAKVREGYLSLQQASTVIGNIYYQQIQAKQYLRRYYEATGHFKELLGIPPNVTLVLQAPDEKTIPGPLPPPEELHLIALSHRPELFYQDVQMAIHEDELKQAILTMFPELTPFIDFSYDSNPFFRFNYWATTGFRVMYRLLSIPLAINAQLTAKDQMRLAYTQRLLTSLSVLSQIHIAYALYEDARSRFLDAHIYWLAKKNSYELALAKKKLNAIADLDYVFPLSDLAYADAQKNLFYVEMMGYLEQINNSIGIPRYFTEDYNPKDVEAEEKQQ